MKPFFVTTPIYYVNASPHLGHAYTTIIADSWMRFHKLLGRDTLFLTGTDEHGDKIVQAAEKQGKDPQAFVDAVSAQFRQLWPHLGIANDRFVRTTDPEHKAVVQAFLQRVYDAGDIYFGEFGGHYCYGCERFYTEKELENGLCPQHLTKPEFISEKNYFFRMSKYLPWLKEYIQANPDFIRPERYRTETLAMLESGALEDLCISRPKSRLTWGIELPFDKDYVCYVWFDALINYISALGGPEGADFQRFWPGVEHVVAKDILKPHAVFWPTMLHAAGLPLYRHLNVHGYWLARDAKMSKSLGNVVDPLAMSEHFGLDAFRYFLLREMAFGSDASFTQESMTLRINADLSNDLGNLFSRVLAMTAKYFDSVTPASAAEHDDDARIREIGSEALRNYIQLFENARFSHALDALWEFVRALNKYVDTQAPWALFKQGDTARLGSVLYTLLDSLRKVARCVWPVMPTAATGMLEQLGLSVPEDGIPTQALEQEIDMWGVLPVGGQLAASSNLFPRREMPEKEVTPKVPAVGKEKKSAAKASQKGSAVGNPEEVESVIAFDQFTAVDIRVGTILSAEKHPDADRILKFMIDLGEEEPRQILSGIAAHYRPEELTGLQVCVVANLAPRVIRGLASHGMVLTAEKDGQLTLVTVAAAAPNGSRIA